MKLTQRMRNGWTSAHIVAGLVLCALGVLVTWEQWADMMTIAWKDVEESHIFLVIPVAAWLIWVRRGRLRYCRPVGTWIGPALVAAAWLIAWVGFRWDVQTLWHGGAVLLLIGCFASVAGKDVLLKFLPAIFVFVFLIPVPGLVRQQIAIPLQTMTAEVTQVIFELVGIEVEQTVNLLTINGKPVQIAEACNGMRGVFTLVLVSYAFAYGTNLRNYARVLILIASPVSAILCNVMRLVPTVWLYGNRSQQTAEMFHDVSGWMMFPVAFLLLMAIIEILRWALIPVKLYTLAYD